jgi:ABC-type nitrate/sulfonate/bicarbonate transport system substrate-binding protein
MTALAVSAFPNAKAAPLWAGVEAGIFHRHGLTLTIDETRNSTEQRAKLASGEIDIVQSAVDNALAMILAGHDVIIVMGGESGMNDFIARADIRSFADFRGRTIVVDAPNTAYALQARKLLARAGLKLDVDYSIKPIGNASMRLRALLESDAYAGAVMNPPFSSEALLAGMKSLGRMVDLLGP